MKNSQTKQTILNFERSILAFVILVLIQQIFMIVFLVKNLPNKMTFEPFSAQSQNEEGEYVHVESRDIGKLKKFTSDKFGFSFSYDESNVVVEEKENKVYVRPNDAGWSSGEGQSVEVFKKNPKTPINKAIAEMAIADKDPRECFVMVYSGDKEGIFTGNIIYPDIAEMGQDEPSFANARCGKYQTTNGLVYFYYDMKYPDRFYFFNIGQYILESGDVKNTAWQDTFEVVK